MVEPKDLGSSYPLAVITESYGPVMPQSVWYAVPPGKMRVSAVGICACVVTGAHFRNVTADPVLRFRLGFDLNIFARKCLPSDIS